MKGGDPGCPGSTLAWSRNLPGGGQDQRGVAVAGSVIAVSLGEVARDKRGDGEITSPEASALIVKPRARHICSMAVFFA